jgi:hypothetical protein
MVEFMVKSELISLDSLLDTLARQKQRAFPLIIVLFLSILVFLLSITCVVSICILTGLSREKEGMVHDTLGKRISAVTMEYQRELKTSTA